MVLGMETWNLRDKVVIITGASSGIGDSTARAIYEAGGHPVLAARRADRLERLGAELGDALAVPTDVTDAGQRTALVESALARHGRIDALVNNAGASLHQPLDRLDLGEFHNVLELNVLSLVAMSQVALPALKASGSGRIVNISSGTTTTVIPGVGGYAATKSAVNMISAVARLELADQGVTVSVVLPSITATEFGNGAFKPGQELRPGMVAHSSAYVAKVILRALATGEERIDIPHGAERAELTAIPPS